MVEPRLSGREVVFLLKQLDGRVVEGPHAFVGANRRAEKWSSQQGSQRPPEYDV
jgi:hypothetical protein